MRRGRDQDNENHTEEHYTASKNADMKIPDALLEHIDEYAPARAQQLKRQTPYGTMLEDSRHQGEFKVYEAEQSEQTWTSPTEVLSHSRSVFGSANSQSLKDTIAQTISV